MKLAILFASSRTWSAHSMPHVFSFALWPVPLMKVDRSLMSADRPCARQPRRSHLGWRNCSCSMADQLALVLSRIQPTSLSVSPPLMTHSQRFDCKNIASERKNADGIAKILEETAEGLQQRDEVLHRVAPRAILLAPSIRRCIKKRHTCQRLGAGGLHVLEEVVKDRPGHLLATGQGDADEVARCDEVRILDERKGDYSRNESADKMVYELLLHFAADEVRREQTGACREATAPASEDA
jgi:hypothetical protein